MKRRLLIGMALVVILTLAGMFLPADQVAYAMSGSGTEGDPYIITDVDDLQAVQNNLSSWYELGDNIDASATETWNGGDGFTPISAFTGHFDGKGYVISDIFITSGGDQLGLFYANSGTIQNVGIEDATVVCDEKSGILVGQNNGGTISKCYTTGSVTWANDKGKNDAGFVGNNKGTITDCYTTASVTGDQKCAGFVGKQESGTLTNCYSTGAVTGSSSIFGFTGECRNVVEGVTYNDCFWDTETSGQATDYAGSFATGKTTAQMKQQATFTNWDFTNVWDINEGVTYPFLRVFQAPQQPPKVGKQIGAEYPITISPSSMTPQEEWTTITVPVQDPDTLADVDEVMVKVFYDSASNDPDEAGFSADVQTCAILTWTRGGAPWTIAPASTTWAINAAGCSKPSDSATQGNWVFSFKVGKVASHSPGSDDWDIYGKATDAGSSSGEDYLRDKEMNWYGEVTVNTSGVDWGTVAMGSGFTDDATNRVTASVTYICNGNFNKQIKASSPWGSSPTVNLVASETPGSGEFALKTDDDLTLSGAVLVSASYAIFGTGTQTDESGTTEVNNGIWLKTGSSGITGGVSYDGTIYCAITQS